MGLINFLINKEVEKRLKKIEDEKRVKSGKSAHSDEIPKPKNKDLQVLYAQLKEKKKIPARDIQQHNDDMHFFEMQELKRKEIDKEIDKIISKVIDNIVNNADFILKLADATHMVEKNRQHVSDYEGELTPSNEPSPEEDTNNEPNELKPTSKIKVALAFTSDKSNDTLFLNNGARVKFEWGTKEEFKAKTNNIIEGYMYCKPRSPRGVTHTLFKIMSADDMSNEYSFFIHEKPVLSQSQVPPWMVECARRWRQNVLEEYTEINSETIFRINDTFTFKRSSVTISLSPIVYKYIGDDIVDMAPFFPGSTVYFSLPVPDYNRPGYNINDYTNPDCPPLQYDYDEQHSKLFAQMKADTVQYATIIAGGKIDNELVYTPYILLEKIGLCNIEVDNNGYIYLDPKERETRIAIDKVSGPAMQALDLDIEPFTD